MTTRTVQVEELCLVPLTNGVSIPGTSLGSGAKLVNIVDLYESHVINTGLLGRAVIPAGKLAKAKLQTGDLLFVRSSVKRAGTAMCAMFPGDTEDVAFGCFNIRLRPNPKLVDSKFLTFYLRSPEGRQRLLARCNTSTITNIAQDGLASVPIPLPDLSDQRRVAERLEQADRLRRTRRYALELSATFLPAAFLKMFGDPAENPHGFQRIQLEDLFAEHRDGVKCGPFGSALKKHEYVPTGVPVWTMNNVGENEFREDGCLFITQEKFDELSAYDVQNADILISRAGTVGRMAIVRTQYPRSIIHSNIIRLTVNPERILPVFFVSLMTWFPHRVAKLKRGQEDAYTFMSTGSLGELQISLPPLPLQQKFAALVERVERLRAVQRESLRQAEHLFASLLAQEFRPLESRL